MNIKAYIRINIKMIHDEELLEIQGVVNREVERRTLSDVKNSYARG